MTETSLERFTLLAAAKLIDPSGEAVTARTLYNASRAGFLVVQRIGKKIMVSREDLAAFLTSRTQSPTPRRYAPHDHTSEGKYVPIRDARVVVSAAEGAIPQASPIATQLKKLKSRATRFKLAGAGPAGRYRPRG